MTSHDIERRLVWERFHQSTVMPRYTPRGWFECDVCEVTKAGYMVEYEVKTSLSDLRNDSRKYDRLWGKCQVETKHQRMQRGDPAGPCRFYFVTAEGAAKAEHVPAWAGWIVARPARHGQFKCCVHVERAAPQLHRVKANARVIQDIWASCYYRYHSSQNSFREAELDYAI